MKKLALLLLVGIFVACSNEKPKDPNTAIFIEEQLIDFIKANPDWTKDETIQNEITDKFRHKIINLSNEADFLKNMPLQLKSINDTLINEETYKIGVFQSFDFNGRPENSLLNVMDLQINGIVTDVQARTLKVGGNYILNGTLYKQGKRADIKFIATKNTYAYDLGKYTFAITSFKQL